MERKTEGERNTVKMREAHAQRERWRERQTKMERERERGREERETKTMKLIRSYLQRFPCLHCATSAA